MITGVGSRLSRVPILAEIEWRDQGGESLLARLSHELSATAPDPSASATARILAPGA